MSIAYSKDSDTGAAWLTVPGQPDQVTYEQFVTNLCKELGSLEANLNHMCLGIGGEAGEILDAVKKFTIYGKPLDRVNIVEEMGDIEWYLAGMRQMLGITYKEVFETNVAKLAARYSSGSYSDEQAQARADKDPLPTSYLQVIDVTAADYLANPPDPSNEFNAELNKTQEQQP